MPLKSCPKCDHENTDLADVCLGCGNELNDSGLRPSEILIATLVAASLLTVIYFIVFKPQMHISDWHQQAQKSP